MSISPPLNAQVERLFDEMPDQLSKQDVLVALKGMMARVEEDKIHTTEDFYQELRQLSHYILKTRQEIAQIQPELIQHKHIPAATDELDAVVGATEEATGQILDAVEHIESISQGLDAHIKNDVCDAASLIYEACSFQDITGQRIAKVVSALKEIEKTVAVLLYSITPPHVDLSGEEKDSSLESGPQLPNHAPTQADIDKLFNDV